MEMCAALRCNFDGEASFANTSRASQGHKAKVCSLKQRIRQRDLDFSSNVRRQDVGQEARAANLRNPRSTPLGLG